jgi:putative DNA primase/helicase
MLLPVKSNVAPGDIGGLIYQIKGATIADNIETSCIEWTGQTDIDPNDVLSQQQARTRSPKLMEAMDFIEDQLSDGPQQQNNIVKQANDAGISWATLRRAREELGGESEKIGFQGASRWYSADQWKMKIQQENQNR